MQLPVTAHQKPTVSLVPVQRKASSAAARRALQNASGCRFDKFKSPHTLYSLP